MKNNQNSISSPNDPYNYNQIIIEHLLISALQQNKRNCFLLSKKIASAVCREFRKF